MFIRRCAWHPKYHGYSKILGITWSGWGIEFSHGICSDCAARTRAEWRLPTVAPASAAPASRRALRSLRPDFALAAAVVLLAVTGTFALVGVPGYAPPSQPRSAAVDNSAIDETPPSSSGASSTTGSAPAAHGSAPSPSGSRPSATVPGTPKGGTAPQVAEAPAPEPSIQSSTVHRSGKARVSRARGRGVASGAAIVPVSVPELCPCQGDPASTRVAAAPATHMAAAAPDSPSNFGSQLAGSRFNEVQAP